MFEPAKEPDRRKLIRSRVVRRGCHTADDDITGWDTTDREDRFIRVRQPTNITKPLLTFQEESLVLPASFQKPRVYTARSRSECRGRPFSHRKIASPKIEWKVLKNTVYTNKDFRDDSVPRRQNSIEKSLPDSTL
jgi:hypothetical protein